MAKYVIKRVAYGVVTLFVLVSLTFFMQQLLPGDPFVGEKNLPEATMEALYAKYGLDKPVWMQYFIYLGNVLHGDLGISLQNDRPVTTVIGESFVVSFDVGIRAILFAFILGVVLGTLAAIKRGTAVDTICMLVALVGVSVPSFIVASLLQYYLGMRITMALGTPVFATTGWDGLNSKILPVFALGFSSLAQISRLGPGTSMLDVLGHDYIKTAKAKAIFPAGHHLEARVAQLRDAGGHRAGPHRRGRADRRLCGGEHLLHPRHGPLLCAEHPRTWTTP